MNSTLKIGKIAGIRVQIHWTFWLLFLFIGFLVFSQEGTFTDLLWYSLFIVGLFFCVVLHEFGHALTAKKYGISTRSITLLPIGGLASPPMGNSVILRVLIPYFFAVNAWPNS